MSGYVFVFNGHGAFDPSGKVEMDKAAADRHNAQLAALEVESMKQTGRAVLYQRVKDGRRMVGTWEGSFNWPARSRVGRHNMAGERTDYWFVGPDGREWHGVNIGDNDIVRCKVTKGGAR